MVETGSQIDWSPAEVMRRLAPITRAMMAWIISIASAAGAFLLAKARPQAWLMRRAKPAKSADLRPAAVQGELSLDKVKVVRNDLSEADVEVVPAKAAARAVAEAAPVAASAPAAQPVEEVELLKT